MRTGAPHGGPPCDGGMHAAHPFTMGRSHLHDLLLLAVEQRIQLVGDLLGHLVEVLEQALALILAGRLILLRAIRHVVLQGG